MFWIGIGILVIILVTGVIFGLPATKGWAGERAVRGVLKRLPGEYSVLNDVKFYGSEHQQSGRKKNWSCQIDHLVISPYGIFCVETKNFLGAIAGNYKDKYLQRRVLGMRYKTYSPIFQNYRHLQRLVEKFPVIKSHSKDLHSIVCFMPMGRLKIKGSGAATICKLQDLRKNILDYREKVISSSECQDLIREIKSVSINHKV